MPTIWWEKQDLPKKIELPKIKKNKKPKNFFAELNRNPKKENKFISIISEKKKYFFLDEGGKRVINLRTLLQNSFFHGTYN